MLLSPSEAKRLLEFREPTAEELIQINQFRAAGVQAYSEGELYRFALLASNNMIHASKCAWDKGCLISMAKTYPGEPLMIDHAHHDSNKTFGFVYDAKVFEVQHPKKTDYILNMSPLPEVDSKKISTEGLLQVVLFGVVEKSHPIVSDIVYGRKKDVSIGGVFYGEYFCPLCNKSFESSDCKHFPPQYADYLEDKSLAAPYYIRAGKVISTECSFVYSGNCTQAGIILDNLSNFVLQ